MKYKLYAVGGHVRDHLLGIKSKDIDYSVIIENPELYKTPEGALVEFEKTIQEEGYEVFLSTPECFTIRAKFPKGTPNEGLVADFVLARKEEGYIKGTRTPKVVLGTLYDDLERRDFCLNAIAKDEQGNLIDPFNGQKDILDKIIRTPNDTAISFNDDPLRIIRAMRFAITKNLEWADELWRTIDVFDSKKMKVVSLERKREELFKCFKHDTKKTLEYLRIIALSNYSLYLEILPDKIWLEPTTKQ